MDKHDEGPDVPDEHKIPRDDLLITLSQFVQFLQAKNRRTSCPVCDHDGEWIIHGGDIDGESEFIHIYALPHPAGPGYALPAIMLQCPKCAFLNYTNAAAVVAFLKEQGNG